MIQIKLIVKRILVIAIVISSVSVSARAENKKIILMVRSAGAAFEGMHDDIAKELKKYEIKDWVLAAEDKYPTFENKIKSENPDFLILMDNKSVDFGKKWNDESPKKIPGLGLMALNLITILKGNKDLAAITYESPAYTLVTQFRYFVDLPVKTVLVFYRKSIFSEVIEIARQQLSQEKITLVAVDVEQEGKETAKVENFLKTKVEPYLSQPEKYDVIWTILDSALLNKKLLFDFWVPAAQKSKIPFLTGVEPLVSPKLNFAGFAVIPNMQDLAGQAVQIVQRVLEENETPLKVGVEQLISVNKILNKKRSKELGLKLREERLSDVKILE